MTNNDKLSEALELAREIRGATAPRSVTAEMVGGCLEALADHGRELSQKQAAMARGWAQASTDVNVFAAPDEIPLTSPVGLHGEWAASGQPRPGYSFLLITGGLTLQGIVNGVTSGGGLLRISLDFGSLAFGQGLAYSLECDVRTDTPKYAACLRRERIPAAGAYAHTAAVVFDTGTDENARRVNDDAWSALMSYDCHLPSAVLVGVRHKEVTRYGLFFFGGENNITVCDEDGWDVYHIVRGDDGTTLTHWNDLRRVVGRILSLAARLDPADPGAEAMLTCTSGNAVHYIPASDFVQYVRDTLDSSEYDAFLKLGETASTAYPGDKGAKLREDVDALNVYAADPMGGVPELPELPAYRRLFVDRRTARGHGWSGYDAQTNSFWLNEIYGMTYEEAVRIDIASFPEHVGGMVQNFYNHSNPGCRTLFAIRGFGRNDATGLYAFCSSMEHALVNDGYNYYENPGASYISIQNMFYSCASLRKIIGVMTLYSDKTSNAFFKCYELEHVNIKIAAEQKHVPLDFRYSPLLSFDSVRFMVDNIVESASATITVHPDVYAKLTDETNTEWHKVLTDALDKQITFVTI